MAFEIIEALPRDVRGQVLEFFWRLRAWPFQTMAAYEGLWDWRYTCLSQEEPRVWIARDRDDGAVLGHIAVYPRRFRFEGREIRVAVPGNLLVDTDRNNPLLGPRLVSQPRSLVKSGSFDLALAFGNHQAHTMFLRLGFRDLGGFTHYTDVRRWAPVLASRFGPLKMFGPVLDLATTVRRRPHAIRARLAVQGLEVEELDREEVFTLTFDHWECSSQVFEAIADGAFLARRYLDSPDHERRLLALRDRRTGSVEGYVVLSVDAPVRVWDCGVNDHRLSKADAIEAVASRLRNVATITVSVLPDSRQARDLRRRGFIQKRPESYEASRWWSAYWLEDHPLATAFEDRARWDLLYGSTHY